MWLGTTPGTYTETKSGDGIFSKKTRSAETNASAFYNSISGYYKELDIAAKQQLEETRKIAKLKEIELLSKYCEIRVERAH